MKKIILVDDHVIIRNGLKELIEKLGPYQVVAQFDNGKDFVDQLPIVPPPDLVIMDITMPEMDGDEVVRIMKSRGISMPILILTLNTDENRLVRLFRNGVRGYMQKNCTAAMLKEALREIFEKGYYHNEHMAYALTAEEKALPEIDKLVEKLTDREREFIRLICDENEYTYKQIADIMSVHHRTVDGYRETVFDKFGVKSKSGFVLFAYKHKLIDVN